MNYIRVNYTNTGLELLQLQVSNLDGVVLKLYYGSKTMGTTEQFEMQISFISCSYLAHKVINSQHNL